MKSDKYWAKRAEKRMDYAMLSSNEVSGRIGAAYLEALRDIQEQLQAIFRSFSADITDAEAKRILQRVPIDRDADITKLLKQAIALVKDDKERAELIAELNVPAYKARMQRLKELSQDIGDKCAALAQEAGSSLDRSLEQVIRDTYYRGVFDMQQRTGIAFSFSKVSERMIREILQQAWSGRHYSKRIWQNTDTLAEELRQTLLKGVLTGKSSGRMAAEIQDRFHASYSRALTLVRTEHSYCANSAELARYKDIDVKKYRFVATLDSHTSEICRDLDGQEFPVEDAAPGTNYPPMHPRCRSTTIEALSAALMQKLERSARDPETGKLMTVPADMTYREWYGKYVEGEELTDAAKLQASEPRFKFIEAKNLEEAQAYAQQFCESSFMAKNFKGVVDYKGISVENANKINRALTDVYNRVELDKLSGIKTVAPGSALGKKAFKDGADAVFSYDPIQHGIYVNKDILKSEKAFAEYVKRSEDSWNTVMNNIDKLSGSQKELALVYQKAGRSLVDGTTVEGMFTHELGHHAQWTLLDAKTNNSVGSRMNEFAPKISGYANASKSEYLAESFGAYIRGERSLLDPEYVWYIDSKAVDIKGKSDIMEESKAHKQAIDYLEALGIKSVPTKAFDVIPSESEIINRLSGGDMTKGSCTSLALAYAGNKGGVDVLDFRGGKSCDFFSKTANIRDITKFNGVKANIVKDTNDFKAATELLKTAEPNKEYILVTGKHTAVIRKAEKGFEYLNMQDPNPKENVFKPLTTKSLKSRFKCAKSHRSQGEIMQYTNILIDRESLSESKEFKDILRYINTEEINQLKGVEGYAK